VTYGIFIVADEPWGFFVKATTPVKQFPPADHWHSNYQQAPTNGSAWTYPEQRMVRMYLEVALGTKISQPLQISTSLHQ
jgi:formylglycine-generating enzyme required for sulfatase activity